MIVLNAFFTYTMRHINALRVVEPGIGRKACVLEGEGAAKGSSQVVASEARSWRLTVNIKSRRDKMDQKPRILLVDDDADFIEQNRTALGDNGFTVVAALSGREALDKVRFEQPDLIVLDLMLEKHDTGFTVAKVLKADPLYRRIPILMLSSATEKTGYEFSQEQDGYWMKTDDYVSKPVQPEELVARIKALLAKGRAAA